MTAPPKTASYRQLPAHAAGRKAASAPERKPGTGRQLLALLGPQWALISAALVCGIVSVGLNLMGPKMLGRATDLIVSGVIGLRLPSTITQQTAVQHLRETHQDNLALVIERLNVIPGQGIDFHAVNQVLLVTLALYVTNAVILLAQGRMVVVLVQRVVHGLRARLEAKLARLPLSAFDTMPKGEVLSRMTNDIDNVQRTLQQTLSGVIVSLFSLLGALAFMFMISPLLLLIALVSVPLAGALATLIAKRAQVRFGQQWAAAGALNSYIEEMYTGHSLVKGFGKSGQAEAAFDERNQTLYAAGFRAQYLAGSLEPGTWLVTNLVYIAVAVVGAIRIGTGSISVGDVQAFAQYTGQFSGGLAGLANVGGLLQSGLASTRRVFEVLDAPEEEPDPENPIRVHGVQGKVDFDRVSFSYVPDKPLIEDLNLTILPGQTLAIVGHSGSGKSTLGNLLMRFREVDGGRILIDGMDIARMTRDDLRRNIGLVAQDTWIFEGTIAENIAYGKPDATHEQIVTAAKAACVDRFVRLLPDGYDTILDPDAATISAGELQLLTVARVFLAGPPILVLDEATSSVDTRTEMLIRQAMESLSEGRTSFVIAHRLSSIRNADVIVVMDSGKLVERGTHDELIALGGHYAKLAALGAPPAPGQDDTDLPTVHPGDPEPRRGRHSMSDYDGSSAAARELGSMPMAPGAFFPPSRPPTAQVPPVTDVGPGDHGPFGAPEYSGFAAARPVSPAASPVLGSGAGPATEPPPTPGGDQVYNPEPLYEAEPRYGGDPTATAPPPAAGPVFGVTSLGVEPAAVRRPVSPAQPVTSADGHPGWRESIAGLHGSMTHRLAEQAYRRHHDLGNGACAWCGHPAPCMSRLHAAAVIEAAGEGARLSPAMREAIAGLHGSITHRLAVQAYQRHHERADRTCAWCGDPFPCAPRLHAAAVIEAAGEDTRRYDAYQQPPPPGQP